MVGVSRECVKSALVPIVVSATGHRFINTKKNEIERINRVVHAVFNEIEQKFPNSPIILMSPLAEGADRIISEIAFQRGHNIYILLPMKIEYYKRTFKSSEAIEEYNNLVTKYLQERKNKIIEIYDGTNVESSNINEYNNMAFLRTAEYLAQNSQILIALWDGFEQPIANINSYVGTYKTIALMRKGYYVSSDIVTEVDDVNEGGIIYHIPVEREGYSITQYTINTEFYEGISNSNLFIREISENRNLINVNKNESVKVCRQIEEFNREILKNCNRITAKLNASIEKNLFILKENDLVNLEEPLTSLIYRYGIADQLAIYHHKRRDKMLKYFWIIALIGVFFFNAYSNIDIFQTRIVLMLYPMIILSNYMFFRIIDNSKSHFKYIDYRVLAEGLRIQLFWEMSQIYESVTDYYLLNQQNEFNWIRKVIRTSLIDIRHAKNKRDDIVSSINKVKRNWIEEEKTYYDNALKRNSDLSNKGSKVTNLIYFLGLVIVFFLGLFDSYISLFNKNIRGILFLLVSLIPLITTIYKDRIDRNVSTILINQYLWMSKRFSSLVTELEKCVSCNDISGCQRLLIQIGKEQLVENATWAFFNKEKVPKVPQA